MVPLQKVYNVTDTTVINSIDISLLQSPCLVAIPTFLFIGQRIIVFYALLLEIFLLYLINPFRCPSISGPLVAI